MSKTLLTSFAGAVIALLVTAWPATDASATPPQTTVGGQGPTISQPGLQGNLVRQRAETTRAAAIRAVEARRDAPAKTTGTSTGTTSESTTR